MNRLRKCLVWDLDNTLWDGVLLEEPVSVKPEVVDVIKELDSRGILNSIASRGDERLSLSNLEKNNLKELFLVPQINWQPKSQSILKISSELNISFDAIAFIDDDEFELEQISYMLPDVLTFHAEDAKNLPMYPDFSPLEITAEAKERRKLYQAEMQRKTAEENFKSRKEFLISCRMKLTIRSMREDDITRVLELMTRTHQLNTTGIILTKDEIKKIYHQGVDGKNIFVAELEDRFGWYGIVGVAMCEADKVLWRLNYLAISCRVMGRGIEKAILITLVEKAIQNDFKSIEAEFIDTGRNKMMRGLYQMSGFVGEKNESNSDRIKFYAVKNKLARVPEWVQVL